MDYLYISEFGAVRIYAFPLQADKPAEITDETGVVYRRVFTPPQVRYNAPGFAAYDRMMGDPCQRWAKEHLDDY